MSAGQADGILICASRRAVSRKGECASLCGPLGALPSEQHHSVNDGEQTLHVQEREGTRISQTSCRAAGVALPSCAAANARGGGGEPEGSPFLCSDLTCPPARWRGARPPTTRQLLPA